MPINYSKFDHIEDSDDEKPDPKAAEAAERRRELADQLKAQLAGGSTVEGPGTAKGRTEGAESAAAAAEEAQPAHQQDRFAHSEADVSNIAKESLKQNLSKIQGVKHSGGLLSVVAVDKVEGEATKAQIRGEDRYIFDVGFNLKVAYKWMGANFDAGMQRAEALVSVADFASETTLDSGSNAPAVGLRWTDAEALQGGRRVEVEEAIGARVWPPPKGSVMAQVVEVLRSWSTRLPEYIKEGQKQERQAKLEMRQESEEQ